MTETTNIYTDILSHIINKYVRREFTVIQTYIATAILFLLVQNRQQTNDLTLIGSGANGPAYKSVRPSFEN